MLHGSQNGRTFGDRPDAVSERETGWYGAEHALQAVERLKAGKVLSDFQTALARAIPPGVCVLVGVALDAVDGSPAGF